MNIYKYLAIIFLFFFASCGDFLEESPKDRLGDGNFYNTLEDAQSAVNAIYNPIRTGVFIGPYFLQTEIMADYAHGRGSTLSIGEYKGLDVTNIARVAIIWNNFYRSIRNANIAIEAIPAISSIDEDLQNALVAEARFMRAFSYFHLVRHWGAVPLYLNTSSEATGRKSVEEVYEAIIADLKFGEEHLPNQPSQYGKPTHWAAKALLSEVYLTTEQWELSKDKAQEVIDGDGFSLVSVNEVNDWNNVFGPSVNGSSEEIFYIKFNNINGWEWPSNLLWSETEFSPFGNYVIYSTLDNRFLNEWDDQDLRKQWDIFTEYTNRNTGELETLPESTPILFSKWRDPAAPTSRGHGNDYPFLRFADILLIHAEAAAMAAGSPTAAAIENLNKIKRRAYGFPYNTSSPVDFSNDGWTLESFRDAVLQERGYEFFMEGKRWLDLKRAGKIKAVILTNLGKVVEDIHLFWPIPQQEVDTNPEIDQSDQNPGY